MNAQRMVRIGGAGAFAVLSSLFPLGSTKVHLGAETRAAPSIIIADGGVLRERIVMSNPSEILKLFAGLTFRSDLAPGDNQLAQRPYVDLWMFWGPKWIGIAKLGDTALMSRLRHSDADQHGRFYPARGSDHALLELDGSHGVPRSFRTLTREALGALKRNGLPVQLLSSEYRSMIKAL
jgi:hypothetical protein